MNDIPRERRESGEGLCPHEVGDILERDDVRWRVVLISQWDEQWNGILWRRRKVQEQHWQIKLRETD